MPHDQPNAASTIEAVTAKLGLRPDEIAPYGQHKVKVSLGVLERLAPRPNGKLVLVTAISPTPAGEGKTTLAIGLCDALCGLGRRVVAALRQPSMGPVFGRKGGGTGGGRAELLPPEEINLHFTGDLHAITASNNLLAAVIDNHLHWNASPELEPGSVSWKRCLDVNDRALRRIVTGLDGNCQGGRESGFNITAASEVMAVLSLSESYADLASRLSRIIVGTGRDGAPVTAGHLRVSGAMAALLKDALQPNLVQTREGAPVFVHGGPFGNIAHGCSSVLGTRMALKLGDICVTEAGFGADLGAEKFMHIKSVQSGLQPDLAVLAATARTLKFQGGVHLSQLEVPDAPAVEAGFPNLQRHVDNLGKFGLPVVVAVNRFAADTQEEIDTLLRLCGDAGLPVAVAEVWIRGGPGGSALAELVLAHLGKAPKLRPLYPAGLALAAKIEIVVREVYRGAGVRFSQEATERLQRFESWGFGRLPVCVAKTQYSFSDDPESRGAPSGHTLTVRDVELCAGAGFVVAHAGSIMTMPGLPRQPGAERIGLSPDGSITGLF